MKTREILKLAIRGGWLWKLPENKREEAELIHDIWLAFVSEYSKKRHEEIKLVRVKIKEWMSDPEMMDFAKKSRMRYLKKQRNNLLKELNLLTDKYVEATRGGASEEVLNKMIKVGKNIDKKIKGYEISIGVLEGKIEQKDMITDEMIEKAREYPIENLVEVNKIGRAKCPECAIEGHNMDIRNNFGYCYKCNSNFNSLDIYIVLNPGISFREAVLSLQN